MAALSAKNPLRSSSSPARAVSGTTLVTATADPSAPRLSSSTAGPSIPVPPTLSISASASRVSHSDSKFPSTRNVRVAPRNTFRWTSTDFQHTSPSPPTRTTGAGNPSSSRTRQNEAPHRYESARLSEKPPGPPAFTLRTPPPPSHPTRFSRASSSSSSSRSSSSQLDEKAAKLPPYQLQYHDDSMIDVSLSEDPLRDPVRSLNGFSSLPMQSVASCPSRPHSRCQSTTTNTRAAHHHSLIEHQRHYGHRVKPPSCFRITIPPAVKPWLPVSFFILPVFGYLCSGHI